MTATRRRLEITAQIEQFSHSIGRDGKRLPRRVAKKVAAAVLAITAPEETLDVFHPIEGFAVKRVT